MRKELAERIQEITKNLEGKIDAVYNRTKIPEIQKQEYQEDGCCELMVPGGRYKISDVLTPVSYNTKGVKK